MCILLILLVFTFSVCAQTTYDGIYEIDVDQELTDAVGYDSLAKFLIVTANPKDQQTQINRQLLDRVVAEMIQSEEAFDLISKDLGRGDYILRDTLVRVLQGFNYPASQASLLVTRWATDGANETVRATFKDGSRRPAVVNLITTYNLETSLRWSHTLVGMDQVFSGNSPITVKLLGETIVRTQGLTDVGVSKAIDAIGKGDVEGRWELARGMGPLLEGRGALARYLSSHPIPKDSWNAAVWRRVAEKIIDDPLLLKEYTQRLSHAAPLYEELRIVLLGALSSNHGTPFARGYLLGSKIPKSRFEWVKNAIANSQPQIREILEAGGNNTAPPLFLEALARKISKNNQADDKSDLWMNYILWHITRPGEASALIVRASIPNTLGNHEELCRKLAKTQNLFGDDFTKAMRSMDPYSYYPGGRAEFNKKLETGQIDRSALLQFGTAVGNTLAKNDGAWAAALDGRGGKSQKLLLEILNATLESDPKVLQMWLMMVKRGDPNLKDHFVQFLIKKGYTKDAAAFDYWSGSVLEALKRQSVVGNPDVGNFRNWFIQFSETEAGWDAIRLRLRLESTAVPFTLRSAMNDVLIRDPKLFWRMYGMLTCATGPSVSTLVPKIEQFASKTQIPQFLLEEIAARNLPAADAIDPIWDTILGTSSPVPQRIMQEVTQSGSTLGDVYRLTALALVGALSDEKAWERVKSIAYNHLRMDENAPEREVKKALFEQIYRQGTQALPFIQKVSQDPVFFEVWRKRLISSVRFVGQAPGIADFLLRHPDLQIDWISGISQMVTREPQIMRTVLEALVKRRVGDDQWDQEMAKARLQLIQLMTSDRIFIEQLISQRKDENGQIIAGKNKEFRAVFTQKYQQKVGRIE